jgi:ribosomal protein S18 acetylase RimI-like enzyme
MILLLVLFFIYIRIKYKFWSIQPVYHFYDVYYWFKNKGIIRHELPEKNKYVNLKDIKTKNITNLQTHEIKEFMMLIKLHYLRDKNIHFSPNKENILSYFTSHFAESYWSFYWESELLLDNKSNKMIPNNKLIGVITSRPLKVTINNGDPDAKFDIYYVDYLCVHKKYRNKNIAPQLIQTHEYNQSYLNKNIHVSLFKREGELTGIVPLTHYNIYTFNVKKWHRPIMLTPSISLLTGSVQNIYYLYNFMNETKKKWDIMILPEMSNLVELVKTNNVYVMMLLNDTKMEAAYIYKKTCLNIENDKEVLSCICSINNMKESDFIQGFKMSTWSILEKNKNFKYCSVEDIADNGTIIKNLRIRTTPFMVTKCAYYFYNFAHNPFKRHKVLMLN